MVPQSAKLILPTVATCPWRHVRDTGSSAECTLISTLTGIRSGEFSAVSDSACEACCQSFPPSPRQLNPVVASLVFSAASRILEAGGTSECSIDHAAHLQRRAEASLDLEHPSQLRLIPARLGTPCCWLGDIVPPTDRAPPLSISQQSPQCNGDEPNYLCRHPAHEVTTVSNCQMCRDWTMHKPVSRRLSLSELVPPPQSRCGPTVRRWAVGITVAPRRQPTLELCLDGIVRAGWDEPRLFLDGSVRVPTRYCQLPVTWREDRIGAWPAWYLALAELILQQPDADAYMLLQDDVAPYDREALRDYLEAVLWPGNRPGMISLFFTARDTRPGWHCADGNWDWGAQGFVFPPGVARALVSDPEMSRSMLAASADNHIPIPEQIYEWVTRAGIDTWYANPSLIQHIGNTSTIWLEAAVSGGRRAPWFSGSVETEFAAEESLADFPEDAFPCPAEYRNQYHERVELGRLRMREFSVVLCGVCRNARHFLPRTAARVERLASMFREFRVVLCDNQSDDSTVEFLRDWQQINPRVDVITSSLTAREGLPFRRAMPANSMATCRNAYRSRVLENYAQFDYVIVFDTDLMGGWSFEGIAHTFGNDNWDFVGSYGLRHRHRRQPEESPFFHFDALAFRPFRKTSAEQSISDRELRLQRGQPLLPVDSCFGGLGICRMTCFSLAEYGEGDCEHVEFCAQMRRAGLERLFLNPSQIVVHTPF